MLSKFSVKKPLTIFLSVILIVILGTISFTKMSTDLLPKINLPYVAVMTAYPGASPEKVETTVTKPLESALSTINGVKDVTSISSENSSMIIFEFDFSTNMDRVMIDMTNSINTVHSKLDDMVAAPILMQINPDMLPVMVASIDIDGMDIVQTTAKVKDDIIPAFERLNGVASVDGTGMVEDQITITLNQEKIDALNTRIFDAVDAELKKTEAQLNDGEAALDAAREKLTSESAAQSKKLEEASQQLTQGKQQLQLGLAVLSASVTQAENQLDQLTALKSSLEGLLAPQQTPSQNPAEMESLLSQLKSQGLLNDTDAKKLSDRLTQSKPGLFQPQSLLDGLNNSITKATEGLTQLKSKQAELQGQLDQLLAGEQQLQQGQSTLNSALSKAEQELNQKSGELAQGKAQFESAKDGAYDQADLNGIISKKTLKEILAAENFSMPAGYLKEDGHQYSIKVGDQFSGIDELKNLELFTMEQGDVGTIKLSDAADIEFTNNADEIYAKINGNDGILLSMQKQSTASTTDVSDLIRKTMDQIQDENPDIHLTTLNDQGDYINIVIQSVIQNLLMGGVLAVIILFFFLKDIRPTFIVGVSIPLSLVLAVVLMYFSGVTLNIISLAGLALGVGMLVDNSIVVIENIYRLRAEGVPPAKAAVQGAGQVAGAITSSTLTTICVFLPIVFTEGISRQLFTDMGLTIAFSLLASLLIALTLIPALSSTMLKAANEKPHRWFDRMVDLYIRGLDRALKHKAILLVSVCVLLGVSIYGATLMGTAFMPATDSTQISVSMTADKNATQKQIRELSDQVVERIQTVPGVKTVGAMQQGSMMGSGGGMSMYVILNEDKEHTSQQISRMIQESTADLDCEVSASSSGMDMSAMAGSGLQVDIKGGDLDTLQSIAKDVAAMMSEIDGTIDVSDGLEDNTTETRILVDKNKAMQYSLTVAQVYQKIAEALQTTAESTTVTIDSSDYPVIISEDPENALTLAELSNFPVIVQKPGGEEEEIKLGDIAQIIEAESLQSIDHDNRVRSMSVTAGIDDGHNIGLVSRQLETKLDSYELPAGYTLSLTGENETINDTLSDLIMMVLLAVAFIYLIMAMQFQSLLSPFIVMFTIPLAFTGGLLALWITGLEISVVSMLGFLVLAGIVVNNGIVFVDYANQLRIEGLERKEALLETGRRRIRPILMTALTTILGLVTLALGIGQGSDMLQPMAVVIIFGLTYATLLTLFVVPAMYDIFQKKRPKVVNIETD